jgi:competence protein ComEA
MLGMDFEAIFARWLPLLKKYWLPIALGFCGLIFFAYGLIALLGSFSKPQDISFKSGSTDVKASQTTQNSIQVDIEGAVAAPGVYKLPANSIIQDALVFSQGLSADADRAWVAKNLNLAAKLYDGAKVYIPEVGEAAVPVTDSSDQSSIGSQNLININTASSDSLDSLPGVGPATITKIVNGRPYQNINDLLDKKVVSSKVFDEIKDKITVY